MIEIRIPSPGKSITEVEISNWLVEHGDYVEKDQEIAEIESDKATLPLIAPESGAIEIIAPAGETIKVGTVACKIDTSAEPQEAKQQEEPNKKNEEQKEEKPGQKTTEPEKDINE